MIIFLDIDGVLVTYDVLKGKDRERFDPKCVAVFNEFLKEIDDVKIIISSTWRRIHSIEELQEIFKRNKVNATPSGVTPCLEKMQAWSSVYTTVKRSEEILTWIRMNNYEGPWIAIDDDIRGLIPNINRDKILWCRYGLLAGIREKEVKRMIKKIPR